MPIGALRFNSTSFISIFKACTQLVDTCFAPLVPNYMLLPVLKRLQKHGNKKRVEEKFITIHHVGGFNNLLLGILAIV